VIRIKQNIIFVYVQLDCEILFKVVVSGVSKAGCQGADWLENSVLSVPRKLRTNTSQSYKTARNLTQIRATETVDRLYTKISVPGAKETRTRM